MNCPKATLFDLDDTLAESFKAPVPEMVERLARVLQTMPVAILSGASFARLRQEILDPLTARQPSAALFAFPDSASAAYIFRNGIWSEAYSLEFTAEQLEHIQKTVEECAAQSGIANGTAYQPKILLEKTQVRYAALGLTASEADKDSWDPDRSKRRTLKAMLDGRLEDCEVLIGGRTTIDITRKGVDKSYGVAWLSKELNIPASDMFYIGDALYEGGNDQVVIRTGIQTRQTSGPEETLSIIDELLAACAVA